MARRKSNKKPKVKSRGKLVEELDAVYSRYIRNKYAKDGFVKCVTCGKVDEVKNMQNGHYVSRSHYATRWLDENCHPQCMPCNVFKKGNMDEYALFLTRTYGQNILEELQSLKWTIYKISNTEIQTKIDFYKQECENLQNIQS